MYKKAQWDKLKQHVNNFSGTGTGVAPLLGEDGKLRDDPVGKAEILNKQFTSVFSQISPLKLAQSVAQTLWNIPNLPVNNLYTSPHASMPDLTITKKGVYKPHKAAGPDSIKPYVLKEFFRYPSRQVNSRVTGGRPT
jgi:hypothetical protein